MYLKVRKLRKIQIRKKKGVSKKKSSTQVTSVTLPQNQGPPFGMPSLQCIRQDAFIQSQVDQRLRDLAQNTTAGTKIKSLGVALWRFWFRTGNYPVSKKKEFTMTNSLLCNGWLASVGS